MSDTADVIVIGAGVQGASLAFHLASRGASVIVVERSTVAAGATGRSSGLVRMHYDLLAETQLAWVSYPYYRDWPERVGGECGFTRTGFLWIEPAAGSAKLRANVADHQALGDRDVRGRDAAAMRQHRARAGDRRRRGGGIRAGLRVRRPVRYDDGLPACGAGAGERGWSRAPRSSAIPWTAGASRASTTNRGCIRRAGRGRTRRAAGRAGSRRSPGSMSRSPSGATTPGISASRRTSPRPIPVVIDSAHGMYFRPEGAELVLIGLEDHSEHGRLTGPRHVGGRRRTSGTAPRSGSSGASPG